MAEGLATAASGIAVLTVAVQLAQSMKKLSDFWTSVKEAPEDIQAITADLALLSSVFARIAHETQHVEPDMNLAATLEGCRVMVGKLTALLNEMEPGFASSRLGVRRWTALKAVLKQGQLEKFQVALDRLKATLLLVQHDQSSRLSRHQHSFVERSVMDLIQSVSSLSIRQQRSDTAERLYSSIPDVDPDSGPFSVGESALIKSFAGNSQSIESDYYDSIAPRRKYAWYKRTLKVASSVMECSLGTIRAESKTYMRISAGTNELLLYNEQDQGENETSFTVYPAGWLIRLGVRSGLRFKLLSSSTQGWKTTLEQFRPVPDDSLIFELCKQGNTSAVRTLLSRGNASVRDTDSDGYTPLHFAAQSHRSELCEMLKSAGADMNALTYRKPFWRAMNPMQLASMSPYLTYAKLSEAVDTFRLLAGSMDFLDADASGWEVLSSLADNALCIGGENEAKSDLLLSMLKLFIYELKAYYIESEIVSLLNWTLKPYLWLEPTSNLLLKLGGAKLIDVPIDGIGGYSILHIRLKDAEDPERLNAVLAKGPDLHLLGFDEDYTPEKESPMSLAMYSSWAFADWLHGLCAIEVDLDVFIDQELENNAMVHPGWRAKTLHDLFDYHGSPSLWFRFLWACSDCSTMYERPRIQPYWRHVLERVKQGIDPDDPSWSDSEVDETQILNSSSEVEESSHSSPGPDDSGNALLDDSNNFWSESGCESTSEVELGSDVHGYPDNVCIRSDCLYDPDEIVCINCWLHYRRTGTRFIDEDSSIDGYYSSEDKSSDDEFSPYLIHS